MRVKLIPKEVAPKVFQIILPEPISAALKNLADVAELDGGFGEFDTIVELIICDLIQMTRAEFLETYDWEQDWFSNPVFLYKKG
jgi:hypothetical protein